MYPSHDLMHQYIHVHVICIVYGSYVLVYGLASGTWLLLGRTDICTSGSGSQNQKHSGRIVLYLTLIL